ncbi:hypothetical protein [Haloplasma contractile]|uniref:Uncharacterized protein n=1 Tax=Haloplasma contractile SSD-17B TaxID=1033810 RepID=U2EDX8_9MOLU|nr:hypothetical protein [Haloplasma contractile]ERJ13198.1 hypothetical protein HLPCO_000817 [Haloplasma contractile SSD-17B]
MKKRLIISIMLTILEIFFLSSAIYARNLPKYNQVAFIIKHISVFAFLAIILIVSILFIRFLIIKQLLRVNKTINQSYKKWFTLIVMGAGLYVVSITQLNYIKANETPKLVDCTYYDQYGHKLYESTLPLSCPNVNVNKKSDEFLSLSFNETVEGVRDSYYINDYQIASSTDSELKAEVDVKIKVEYDELTKSNIKNYEINWLLKVEIKKHQGETVYGYKSVKKVVNNTYLENQFMSNQINYLHEEIVSSKAELEAISHYDFTNERYKRDRLKVSYEDAEYHDLLASINMEYIDLNHSKEIVNWGMGEFGKLSDNLHKEMTAEQFTFYIDRGKYFEKDEDHKYFGIRRYNNGYNGLSLDVALSESNRVHNGYQVYNELFIIGSTTSDKWLTRTRTGWNRNSDEFYMFNRYSQLFSTDVHLEVDLYPRDLWVITERDFLYTVEHYNDETKYNTLSNGEKINQNLTRLYTDDPSEYYQIPYLDYETMFIDTPEKPNIIFERNPIIFIFD